MPERLFDQIEGIDQTRMLSSRPAFQAAAG